MSFRLFSRWIDVGDNCLQNYYPPDWLFLYNLSCLVEGDEGPSGKLV